MRPLSQSNGKSSRTTSILILAILAEGAWTFGCVGGSASQSPPPPQTPPPAAIAVTVNPTNTSVVLGAQASFTATVANTTVTSVSWSVNGVPGGNAALGTITSAGMYTAPGDLPSPATVQVTATSHADPTKSATVSLAVTSDIALTLTPNPASVELGAAQTFQAAVTSSGHPDTAIRWSVSGPACSSACGTVDASGKYTAPQILPSPANATLTAQSVADPSKQISATVAITSNLSLQLSVPNGVPAGGTATIVATLSLSGQGCSGSSCGTLAVVTTQSAGGGSFSNSATYTAPTAAPSPNTITVTVTPQADPSKAAQASWPIQAGVSVSVSPTTATLAANHRVTVSAQVNGSSNTGVIWSVNGIAGGNTVFGQICAVGSNPCQTVTNATTTQVDYLAPGSIPSANPVSAMAVSAADSTKSGNVQITVINHVLVSVMPGAITLAPLAVQGFTASVLGIGNQNVVWQVQGTACSAAGLCATISPGGTYTAPNAPPVPDAIQVVAVSSDDSTQSATANVTISTGANILTLHPSSVYAGGAQGFTLRVDGSGFAASSPGPGSAMLVGGTARVTTCISLLECTAPVTAADVAGSVSVQIQNPNGAKSNAVALMVVAPNVSDEVIALSSSAPNATGRNIVVVDPTTAGVSQPGNDLDLDVAALGQFNTANNSCTLGGSAIPLQRPASGTSTADICIFSQSGLDTSMTYTVSGPATSQ